MAEILAEEAREREAREAELAAERAASSSAETGSSSSGGGGEMSELEKLEAAVEECHSMDLLCLARREKQMAAVEKKRALEEKLAEIKRKKKKKAKKAKKAAAS